MSADPNPLELVLLKKIAIGNLNACGVQELAHCAAKSGCDCQDVHSLEAVQLWANFWQCAYR